MFVVIARSDLAVALQKQVPYDPRIAIFRDADSLPAMNAILTRRPVVVAVDPDFAATGRGAALIAQVRADECLADTSLRVLTLDTDRQILQLLQDCAEAPEATVLTLSRPLEWCGTRHAFRYPLAAGARALVNGEDCQVVNLSATGVHLISQSRLRPGEEFRLVLVKDQAVLRLRTVVAWSTLAVSASGTSYRIGGSFTDAESRQIAPYCQRNDSEPDATTTADPRPADDSAAASDTGSATDAETAS